MDSALKYYQRAHEKAPDNPKVLLCVARTHHELENYGFVSRMYGQLKELDPDLAQMYAYLDLRGEEASRAAEIAQIADMVMWLED